MTPAITAGLARLDSEISAMEARYPRSIRDEIGMLPRDHDLIRASMAEAWKMQQREALIQLWRGQAPEKEGRCRSYGWDEMMNGWRAPPRHAAIYRFLVRLIVSTAILLDRWGPGDIHSEDVVFWNHQYGYGWSATVLSFNARKFTVSVYQDGE